MSSSTSISDSEYATVWSSPPKRPSGRTKFKETRHPVYRGVRRRGNSNRWVCEVRNPNNKLRIWLGTFATADMAARAHDVAMMALRGRSACLNFADSAWLIKLPESISSVQDIKKTAIEAAESFRRKESSPPPPPSSSSSSEYSAGQVAEEIQTVVSDETMNLETMNHDMGFGMHLGSYYANLAEGIELPADWFSDLDDNQWGSPVSLWN